MTPASLSARVLLALVATVVSAAGAWWIWKTRSREPSVVLVDNRAELEGLFARRDEQLARAGDAPPERPLQPGEGGYPPPLIRHALDLEEATTFHSALERGAQVFHPTIGAISRPGIDRYKEFPEHPAGGFRVRTNAMGFHNDEEVAATRPDVRILITGDSHTHGVCNNTESFSGRLAAQLRAARPGAQIEVLNAGQGGYNLYNYLGVVETFLDLAPDVVIVAVYGGNDFAGSMSMDQYFRGRPVSDGEVQPLRRLIASIGSNQGIVPQEASQALYFLHHPDEVQRAMDLACSITEECRRRCAERGVQLLMVYIPPLTRGQPGLYRDAVEPLAEHLGGDLRALEVSDTIADGWIQYLRACGQPFLDLRALYAAAEAPCYWRSDLHINLLGQALIAEHLLPLVLAALD